MKRGRKGSSHHQHQPTQLPDHSYRQIDQSQRLLTSYEFDIRATFKLQFLKVVHVPFVAKIFICCIES